MDSLPKQTILVKLNINEEYWPIILDEAFSNLKRGLIEILGTEQSAGNNNIPENDPTD